MGSDNFSILSTAWGTITENADGDTAWVTPANGKVIDGSLATVHLKDGWRTNSLYTSVRSTMAIPLAAHKYICSGYKFNITCDQSSPSTTSVDCIVQMCNDGALLGNSETVNIDQTSLTSFTLGAEDDLWGQTTFCTITPGKNFGFLWYFTNNGDAVDLELDGVTFDIWYYLRHSRTGGGGGFG